MLDEFRCLLGIFGFVVICVLVSSNLERERENQFSYFSTFNSPSNVYISNQKYSSTVHLPCFFCSFSCVFITFDTIFCSSIKNARTIRLRTQLAHREPPYARVTVFKRFVMRVFSRGRAGVMPRNFSWQSPHFGIAPFFFVYKYTNRFPGVFDTLRLFEVVL